jgi:hypothetical protein
MLGFPLRIWGVPEAAVFFACILGFGTGDIWYLAIAWELPKTL